MILTISVCRWLPAVGTHADLYLVIRQLSALVRQRRSTHGRSPYDGKWHTANRPIAQGRLPDQAIIFALLTGLAGIVILLLFTNILTAWLTLASSIGHIYLAPCFQTRDRKISLFGLLSAPPPLGWWL